MKNYILFFFVVFTTIYAGFSQCDYTDEIAVSASGFEGGAGYTQEYVLVNDNSDEILIINGTGTFSSLAGGDYRVYAVNYLDSRPSVLAVNNGWAGVSSYAVNHCLEFIGPYSGSAVTVCNDVCNGSNIVVTSSGFNSSGTFEQRYVLVNSSGTILAANGTGTFTPSDYGNSVGIYTIYAVNTDDATVKAEIDDLGPWSGVTALEATTCFDILGPRYVEVTGGIEASFEVVPDCGGATALFDVNVSVTSIGSATSVNIKDATPTTHQSAVGVGTYTVAGYASGSSQTITVENSASPSSCPVTSSSLSFTCLTLGACDFPVSGSTTLLSESFSSSAIPEGNSSTFISQQASNAAHSGTDGYWYTTTGDPEGIACSGCSSYKAYISSGATNGGLSTLWIGSFTPTQANVTVTFDWGYADRGSDSNDNFKVYLDPSSGSDIVLVNHTGSDQDQSFSNTNISVTPGVTYTFIAEYNNSEFDYGLYGAAIDNIEVEEPVVGSDPNVSLLGSIGSTTTYPQCIDGDWTYYAVDGSSPYLFAVNWSPDGSLSVTNENARDASEAVITLDNNYTSATDLSSGAEQASYSMKRYWNVDFSTGYSLDENVKVRFYYDATEKTAIENAATTFASTYAAANYEGFEWFKTSGSNFDPNTDVTAPSIAAAPLVQDATGTENSVTYVDLSGVSSFSGGTGGTGAGPDATPLPVELLRFWGEKREKENRLVWETVEEKNVEKFEVLSSTDGISFVSIGEQYPSRNYSITNRYSLDHTNPSQTNYYQLKTVDFDGAEQLSGIILITRSKEINTISVFPNPFSDRISLINESDNEQIQCNIYDITGKLVLSELVVSQEYQLNTSTLAKGSYTIEVISKSAKLYQKIIKNE